MAKRFCLLFLAGIFFSSQTVLAAVTGRVIDGAGTPVADAMVTYTNLNNRLVYAYSCSNGRFSIIDPATWNVKNLLMYDCGSTEVDNGKSSTGEYSSLNLGSRGGMIHFHVFGTQHIAVQLFSLDGRKIQSVFSGILKNGTYLFNPFSHADRLLARQAYVVQVSNGSDVQSKSLFYTGKTSGEEITAMDEAALQSGSLKISSAPAVDTVRVGKTNYTATKKPVSAYTGDIGDITIAARNIEGQIDSIMGVTAHNTSQWRANQVTQGVQYNTSNNWGTVFYGVGNGGPTYLDNANADDSWQTATMAAQGTPKLVGIDAVRGFLSPPGGTFFPHNIGMGCTRNPLLAELEERITAIELRSMGINWAFAPVVDVPRSIYWGRTYEGWDETPDGTVPMVVGAVRGFQGTDLSAPCVVAATAKHFAGGGGAVNGTNAGNCATGTNAVLCKIHLPPFKAAIQNGLASTMAGMCSWQGTPMHFNKPLLTDTLKTAWKFDGFVVGDWDASNPAASGGLVTSFNDGVDNMMHPENPADVYGAVQTADTARLSDACKRILRIKLRLNLMQNAMAHREFLPLVKSALHAQVARECVRRSIVLLKNDAFNGTKPLPISPTANVHVVGTFADSMYYQCGGWCLDWPSAYYDTVNGIPKTPPSGTTLRAGIQAACQGTVTYSATSTNIPSTANVIVVCVGEKPYAESGGDAPNNQPIALTTAHQNLITQCVASGKPVVVVLYSGRPLIITSDIAKVPAWIAAWLPGTEGGGIADILFSVNGEKPTGKLCHTWPSAQSQIPMNTNDPTGAPYGDFVGSGGTPLFAYGFGLTY
jgi:beta-glucosidase